MNFDTSIVEIGWKMGKVWAFKEFNIANILNINKFSEFF